MKYLDLTLAAPQQNLACDEVLINLCENGYNNEILRFWEPHEHFVVVGYSNKIDSEVNLHSCRTNRIPVLRRCSGGGAVLQGPGCLNYSLVLRIEHPGPLVTISQATTSVMTRHRESLQYLIGSKIRIQGFSDLSVGSLKFSGNSQYRKRRFLLFHGTFLLNLDISLMEMALRSPSRQPLYRQGRSHREFLTNLHLPAIRIKQALQKVWGATEYLERVPLDEIEELAQMRYAADRWTYKF